MQIANQLAAFQHSIFPPRIKITVEDVVSFVGRLAPGAELLRQTYLLCITMYEDKINPNKQPIEAQWISMDHTFRVSVNIGIVRQDGTWVNLYDSLFIVLNQDGLVLSYKLVKGRSFDCIEAELTDVRDRLMQNHQTLTGICIDNCCHWRGQLTRVFGPSVPVKLDLFHAVQRITATIPRGQPCKAEFIRQLRLVFRRNGDCGKKRQCATASVPDMLNNIRNLGSKASYTGR